MGLGWDAGCDVDAGCAMLDARKVLVDIVNFGQLKSRDGSIKHSGDDRTGEGGESQPSPALPVTIHLKYNAATVFALER
eukprot:1190123-Prorocentrum_minimum.AAC.3